MLRKRVSLNDKCERCPFYKTSKVNNMKGEGPLNPEIMLVGEAPGFFEERTGKPFVGDAGILLNYLLRVSGLDRKKLFVSNAVRCRPPENKTPLSKHINACRPFLFEEVGRVDPKVIVALGRVAEESLIPGQRMVKVRGKWYFSEALKKKVLPTVHPAAILRSPEMEPVFLRDMEKLRKELNEPFKVEETRGDFRVIKKVRDLEILRFFLLSLPEFAFDLETSGQRSISFNYLKSKIICISFCGEEDTAYVLPLLKKGGDEFWSPEEKVIVMRELRYIFESRVKKIGANIKFDVEFLKTNRIEVENIYFDTMLAHHLIEVNQPHSLDFLSTWYGVGFGRPDRVQKYLKEVTDDFLMVDEKILWDYTCGDVISTYRLKKKLEVELVEKGLDRLFFELTMPLCRRLIQVELRGVKVDVEKLKQVSKEYGQRIESYRKEIGEMVSEDFNPNSSKQLSKLLFSDLGFEPEKFTAGGQPSTDEEVLEQYKENKVVDKVLKLRRAVKFKSTYLDGKDGSGGMFKLLDNNGRLHTSYLVSGTRSGRLSSSRPNLQNIPNEKELRSLFVVERGWKFIESDYEQIEMRVLAFLSGDKILLDAFKRGIDVHTQVASVVMGIPVEEVTKEKRKRAKEITYGMNYGRSKESLVKEYGKSGEEFVENYFNALVGVRDFFEAQKSKVLKLGYVENIFGRKRTFPFFFGWYNSPEASKLSQGGKGGIKGNLNALLREACHFPVSSTASDVLSYATIKVGERFDSAKLKASIVMTLHDAIFIECPVEEVGKVLKILKEEMPCTLEGTKLKMELPVNFKVGDCWEA